MVQLAANIWADGPTSMPYQPPKSDIRSWGTWVEGVINAFTSNGGLVYTSRAALFADLAHGAPAMAWVLGDTMTAYNGIYAKAGISGSGSWSRVGDLPYSFIVASDTGGGTPNAIQATSSLPISASALVLLSVFEVNTSSPVTVTFNSGGPLTIKTSAGADVVAGGLPAGFVMLGYVSGSTFRLLSEQLGSAFLAQLQAMLDAATALATPGDGTVTAPKLYADVAVRLMEFDIRDSRFAGGARFDDSTNDTPAFAAAYAYFATLGGLTQYEGLNAARLHMPRGVSRVSNLDVTTGTNVHLVGEGEQATTLRNINNNPCIKSSNLVANSLFRTGFRDFTIFGPGRSNVNAHGFDLGALNNGFYENVRIYASRDGLRVRNNWQTIVSNIKMDGGTTVGGALTVYNGIHMLDGELAVAENCIKLTGGVISGAENWGFRGESVCGSVVVGLEMVAIGNIAMYLGDSPGGKDLKWFSCFDSLFDTAGDLLVVHRGGSTIGEQMHFSGMWMGNANAGSGQGEAISVQGIANCYFQADTIANVDIAINAAACSYTKFEYGKLDIFDRSNLGVVPIQLANCQSCNVVGGPSLPLLGSPGTIVLAETTGTDATIISGINAPTKTMTIIGANTKVHGNITLYKLKATGNATITSGTASIVVNHGLSKTPTRGQIHVTPKDLLTAGGVAAFAVDTITSTQFTIRVNANASASIGFDWLADAS